MSADDDDDESHSSDSGDAVTKAPLPAGQLGSWDEWCGAFHERVYFRPTEEAKIVMNGPAGGGKTSFLARAVTGEFQVNYVPTMVDAFTWTERSDKYQQDVHLGIYDTFGRSDYDRLRPLIYPQTDLMVFCFDVMSRSMFESMFDKYLPEVNHHIPGTPIVLLGLKADLRDDPSALAKLAEHNVEIPTRKEIESRARKFNMQYFETSAKADPASVTSTLAAFAAIVADHAHKAAKKKEAKKNQNKGLGGWFRRLISSGNN